LNNTVCPKEILSRDKLGDSVKYCKHSVGCSFLRMFYNQEIVKMEKMNGDKKCCFRENIGTSTHYIAGKDENCKGTHLERWLKHFGE